MSSDPISKYDSHGFNYCTPRHDTYELISPLGGNGRLQGRYVLVTGGSRGIGLGTAISFAQAGAKGIAVTGRSSLDAAKDAIIAAAHKAGRPTPIVVAVAAQIDSPAEVAAAGKAISDAFGGQLDAMVLNAGSLELWKDIADQDPMAWWQSYSASVLGSYLCIQTFVPMLQATKGGLGTVVATSSIGATSATPQISGLQGAKLAQTRLMEVVNSAYGSPKDGKTPVLAYSIHPGAVRHAARTDLPKFLHDFSIDTVQLAGDTTTWLIHEHREWLAGRWISVNWDMEEFLAKRPEIEKRDLLKFRLAMGGEDWSKA